MCDDYSGFFCISLFFQFIFYISIIIYESTDIIDLMAKYMLKIIHPFGCLFINDRPKSGTNKANPIQYHRFSMKKMNPQQFAFFFEGIDDMLKIVVTSVEFMIARD